MTGNPFSADADPFAVLRGKWSTVPFGLSGRIGTEALLALDDNGLLEAWERAWAENCSGTRGFEARGWYHALYADWVRSRKIIDIGSGLAFDSIYFATLGARVTFVDLSETNIQVLRRICALKGLSQCRFLVIRQAEDLEALESDYDAVFGFGSLHHAPESVIKPELAALVRRLKPEGRLIQHAYPKSRWERDGSPPFHEWGVITDGEGTPWAEWYDAAKLQEMLQPARFDLVFTCDYRDGEMNCIDLVRRPAGYIDSVARIPEGYLPLKSGIDLYGLLIDKAWGSTAALEEGGTVRLVTSSQRWSYGAIIPFSRSFQAHPERPDYIQARLTVRQGKVGVSLLGENQTDVIGEEFASPGGEVILCIPVPSQAALAGILIRNVAPGDVPSILAIQELSYFVPV
jgi:SAM-dependent methyltransferase